MCARLGRPCTHYYYTIDVSLSARPFRIGYTFFTFSLVVRSRKNETVRGENETDERGWEFGGRGSAVVWLGSLQRRWGSAVLERAGWLTWRVLFGGGGGLTAVLSRTERIYDMTYLGSTVVTNVYFAFLRLGEVCTQQRGRGQVGQLASFFCGPQAKPAIYFSR